MLVIDCPQCGRRELVGNRRIRSIHNTDRGPIGDVVCGHGHPLLFDFRRGTTVSVTQLLG